MTGADGDAGEDPPSVESGDEPADEHWDVTLEDLEAEDPEPIEPGSPSPEHVAFVLLGVVLTLAVIYRLATLVGATIG